MFGIEKYEEYRTAYVQSCNFIFESILIKENIDYEVQTLQIYDSYNSENRITLKEKENGNEIKYYYNNKNYSMTIETIAEDDNKEYNEYDEEEYNQDYNGIIFDFSQSEKKYKVSIIKSNGEKTSSIVYLPNFDENMATLGTFTNGYIEFISEDKMHKGWYDNNGNKIEISNIYEITDIRDNKVILKWDNSNDEDYNDDDYVYEQKNYIIDSFGNILLQAKALCILDKDLYLVKNDNNKMILMDKDLNVISNEYDRIIASAAIDLLTIYSSYFE